MKNTLFILIISLHQITSFSQCDNNVSTDYNSTPTNNALPSNSNGENYLNEFNWVPRESSGNLEKYSTQGLNQGLLLTNNEINNIYSDQASSWYSYIFNDIEPSSENGWELIGVNLGYYPNGDPFSSEFNDFPYILLYNKYSGVLRVFGLLGPGYGAYGTSINAVVISLNFFNGNDINGMFRLSEGYDKALDQNTEITRIASVTEHPNANGRWFSADFHMAYDPCVCYYKSQIEFNFEFIESQDITAQINAVTIEEDLIDGNLFNTQVDFLNNFEYNETGVNNESSASNGYVIYKAMEDMVINYIAQLEAYEAALDAVNPQHKEVKKNIAILKAFENLLSTGLTALVGVKGLAIKALLEEYAPFLLKPNGELDGKSLLEKGLKTLAKDITSYIGDNFLETEEMALPVAPVKPMASFTQMNMQGEITRTTKITGPRILTPGTYGGDYTNSSPILNSPHSYPVYNEALGHFALLKSPKLLLYQGQPDIGCVYSEIQDNDSSKVTLSFNYLQQFKLKEELEYVINPTLDIKDYTIDISIGSKANTKRGDFQNSGLSLQDYALNNTDLSANIESLPYDFYEEEQLALYKEIQTSVGPGYIGGLSVVNIQTPFLPIDAAFNIPGSLGSIHEFEYRFIGDQQVGTQLCNHYMDPQNEYLNLESYNHIFLKDNDFYLKVMLNVHYEQDLNDGISNDIPNKKTYIFTYKINPEDITIEQLPIDYDMYNSPNNIGQYPENMSLNGVSFDGSSIEGCELIGSTYTCKAWNIVILSGEFTVDNGYSVNIEAGEQVLVLPESITPPEMIWQIVPVLNYENPMPPQTALEVKTFCEDIEAYNARGGTKILTSPLDSLEENTPSSLEEQDNFSFNLYPNPTGGQTTVALTLDEQSVVDLVVTDISGKILLSGLSNAQVGFGRSEYQLATETLATGIYLVHLSVNGERHVKRLIKN